MKNNYIKIARWKIDSPVERFLDKWWILFSYLENYTFYIIKNLIEIII